MRSQSLRNEQGFSLIEALIAMVIVAVGLLTLITMQTSGIKGNAKAGKITISSGWGADRLERLFALDYEAVVLKDDVAPNGAAGLDEIGATADDSYTSPDGHYTIYWNIADELVMPNTKTIRAIIVRNDMGTERTVTMNYLKAKYM